MNNGTETINDFLHSLQEGHEHLVEVSRQMLDDGKKEHITFALQKRQLEPEQPKPRVRVESPKRAHEFFSVASFVEYLKVNKTAKTVVLADVSRCSIQAVIDESAEKGFEVIAFKPQVHPLFAPWQGVIDRVTAVKAFALFLQQNKRTVASPEVQALTLLFSQIRASQKITMHKGVGKNSINGLTCELNIVGKVENQEVEIPDVIALFVPIFIDTAPCAIELDVLLDASDTEVFVSCSSSDLKVKTVEAFESMLTQVREIEDIVIGFGAIQTEPWEYLRR